MICSDKRIVDFEQIAIIPYKDKLYAIMRPKGHVDGVKEGEAVLFEIDEFRGTIVTINNPEVIDIILRIYNDLINDED